MRDFRTLDVDMVRQNKEGRSLFGEVDILSEDSSEVPREPRGAV